MKKIAVFPGSFDPITLGHYDIILRALNLFDEIIIAIGENYNKKYMFSTKKRKNWIVQLFINHPKIRVEIYKGLTITFCKKKSANFILRGLRNIIDFELEKSIFYTNESIKPSRHKYFIETVFLLTSYKFSHISSNIVRNIIKSNGNYSNLVPFSVKI